MALSVPVDFGTPEPLSSPFLSHSCTILSLPGTTPTRQEQQSSDLIQQSAANTKGAEQIFTSVVSAKQKSFDYDFFKFIGASVGGHGVVLCAVVKSPSQVAIVNGNPLSRTFGK